MRLQSVLLCLKVIVSPKQIMLFPLAVGSLFFPLRTEKYCSAPRPQQLKVIQLQSMRARSQTGLFKDKKKERLGRSVTILPWSIKSIFLSIN